MLFLGWALKPDSLDLLTDKWSLVQTCRQHWDIISSPAYFYSLANFRQIVINICLILSFIFIVFLFSPFFHFCQCTPWCFLFFFIVLNVIIDFRLFLLTCQYAVISKLIISRYLIIFLLNTWLFFSRCYLIIWTSFMNSRCNILMLL